MPRIGLQKNGESFPVFLVGKDYVVPWGKTPDGQLLGCPLVVERGRWKRSETADVRLDPLEIVSMAVRGIFTWSDEMRAHGQAVKPHTKKEAKKKVKKRAKK